MTLRLAPVHEDCQLIPLLAKEGLGVVDWYSNDKTHHPLPPPPPRRGIESGPQRTEKSWKGEKMLNSRERTRLSLLESAKVPKNELKTNWFLSAKKAKRTQKWAEISCICCMKVEPCQQPLHSV